MDTEASGAGSTSPAGARGLMQVMPNYVAPGENPFDPETSIREGIRAIKDKRAAVGNDPTDIAGAYFGYGTDAGGMTTGGYRQRFEQQMQNYTSAPQTVPMSNQESTSAGGGNMVTYQDQWGNQFTTTQDKFDQRSKMPGGNSDVTVISRQQGQAAANAAGAQTRPPANMNMMTMPIKNQFDMGLPKDAAEAACGPAAVALFMEATGRTPNRSEVMQIAAKNGWTAERGMGGVEAFKKTLSDEGVNYATLPTTAEAAQQSAAAGNLTAISTPGHYFVAQGFDQQSQRFDLGATGGGPGGALADPRASRFMSAQEIQALEGPINGVIQLLGAVPPAATEAAASLPPVAAGVQGVADASTTATPAVDATTTALTAVPPAAEAAGTGIDALGAGLFDIATAGPAVVVPATETITASFDTMAVGSLQSVTDLGTGVLTTVQDMSGNTVATITDMTGQVTSQSATLASGVSLNMADMGAQSTASVDAMTGNITTVVSDMAGNTITTVSDRERHGCQPVRDHADAGRLLGGPARGDISATEFGKISSAATSTKGPIEGVNTSLQSIKAPNVKPVLDALGSIETAAEQAERAAKQLQQTVGGFGGEKGGGSSKSPFAKGKAVGGSVFAGQAYMVGDGIGPEVFVPDTNGRIIPRISSIAPGSGALYMGGGGQSSGDHDRRQPARRGQRDDRAGSRRDGQGRPDRHGPPQRHRRAVRRQLAVTERFSNEWSSSLATAINASQTSFALTSAPPAALSSGTGASGSTTSTCWSRASPGVTVTVTRGAESTTAVSHAILADVSHILTAGGLQQAILEGGTGGKPTLVTGSVSNLTTTLGRIRPFVDLDAATMSTSYVSSGGVLTVIVISTLSGTAGGDCAPRRLDQRDRLTGTSHSPARRTCAARRHPSVGVSGLAAGTY
jgi:hypothetical protein